MRRRDFITTIGGAAVMWPLGARAQQAAMPVIGFLAPVRTNEELMGGFREGLKRSGFIEGDKCRSCTISPRMKPILNCKL
jgi:putative ABC transport system substrate-binding protein